MWHHFLVFFILFLTSWCLQYFGTSWYYRFKHLIGVSQLKIVKTCTTHFVDWSKRMLSQMAETTRDVRVRCHFMLQLCRQLETTQGQSLCTTLAILCHLQPKTVPYKKGFTGVKLWHKILPVYWNMAKVA